MNRILSYILAGLFGASAGAGVTFIITKYVMDKKYNAAIEKNYRETQKHFEDKYSIYTKLTNTAEPPKDHTKDGEIISEREEINDVLKSYQAEDPSDEYPHIEVIDEDIYCNPSNSKYYKTYDHIDITWFEQDDIFMATDSNEVIHDSEKLIGFGFMKFNEGCCFIRNKKNKADYMVVYNPGSYAEEILGIEPDFAGERDEE